jgi:predicted DsbA family dithiol-disulfide isomerase
LFNRQASLGSSAYSQIATSIGLNVSQFESCINNGTYGSEVAADLQDATNAGGRGTPYAVIVTDSGDTIPISGAQPFAQFQSIISGLL